MKFRDQTRANTQIYVKTQKGKITEEIGFHYDSEKITMVIAWSHVLEFLGLIDHPPSRWKEAITYTDGCLLDKVYRIFIYQTSIIS